MARPSKWKDEYNDQAYKLALLGATDAQIADFFGISETTVNAWKNDKEGFSKSLKKGKMVADAKVAESLYCRALGYEHDEEKIFQHEGEPVVVPTVKYYPPDPTAAIFWLKNRQPAAWRDKQDISLNGSMKVDAEFNIVEPYGNS